MEQGREKIKVIILSLIGTVFTVYGLLLCALSNLNTGSILVAAFGIIFLCWGVFYSKTKLLAKKKIFKIFKILLIILLCIETALISFLAIYASYDNADYSEDAVIVLGASIRKGKVTLPLKLRLDRAIEYHRKNPDALIIVTGGKGFQETVSEAFAMKEYLVQNGVDKNKIIMEEKATSTSENMKFSKEILDNYFKDDYKITVITNNFHVFRGVSFAKRTGFKSVTHIHAGLQWFNLMPCFLRESLAIVKMYILNF